MSVVVCCASSAVVVYTLMSVDRAPRWHIAVPWSNCACWQICCRVPLRRPLLFNCTERLYSIRSFCSVRLCNDARGCTQCSSCGCGPRSYWWGPRVRFGTEAVLCWRNSRSPWLTILFAFFLSRSFWYIICVCAVPNVGTHPHCVWIWASAEWITTTLYLKACRANAV